jgi:transposase
MSQIRWDFSGCFSISSTSGTPHAPAGFGISRQTFYRWLRRFDRHNLRTLGGRSHWPRHIRQPTWTAAWAERVLALRNQYSCWGKDKLVVLLAREKLYVSVSMVGRILSDSRDLAV